MRTPTPTMVGLPLHVRAAMYFRLLALQGSWNYETLNGTGLGFAMEPALQLVPGLPARLSVLIALFGIALPAMTYMFLSGVWFLKLMAGHPLARRR